ncbi:HNH endonuclease [Methyloglobulus sp.]|uniref:HNH endonuclease n=1 Tax=Methyloglobulus sp. TaxID=2518622 RepID=UPI0032B8211C
MTESIENLEENKHNLADIILRQQASANVVVLFKQLVNGVNIALTSENKPIFFRTHKKGVTGFCNHQKAFMFIDLGQKSISTLYFTGKSSIAGLSKANWLNSGDNMGSKRFIVSTNSDIKKAVAYACAAYGIAAQQSLNSAHQDIPKSDEQYIFPDEIQDADNYYEGAKRTIAVNSYERNLKARRQCIALYHAICSVCEFDFEKKYGEIGSGFIHVHHLTPLEDIGEKYEVDPIKDLRPVCPNCHAMLHKKQPPYSIEELKSICKK